MTLKMSAMVVSGIGSLLLLLWEYIGNYQLCDYFASDGHLGNCPFAASSIETILLPILPLFVFSLVTYFMREEVFRVWVKFAIPWTVLSMFFIFLAPEYGPGGFGPAISLDKSFVALIMSALSVLGSVLVIAWKHFMTRPR